jgi:serine/threonine protein kinase
MSSAERSSGDRTTLSRRADEAYCPTCATSFAIDVLHCPTDGTRLVQFRDSEDPLIGAILDARYQILKPLGKGGMGTVYSGSQISVKRKVAIKVIHPALSQQREGAKRFLREARLASRLSGENIVNVIDFGQTEDGLLYLVMEHVPGETLGRLVATTRELSPTRVVAIGLQLCDALAVAHRSGIVHRDLKPNNVIVSTDSLDRDVAKVLDFGLAKSILDDSMASITGTQSLIGTPTYMSPEQIENSAVDGRTDLYSLGCMLYELATGAPPFIETTIPALFAKHLHELPPPLPAHVPAGLASIIMRLLEKSASRRFASATAVRAALSGSLLAKAGPQRRPHTMRARRTIGFAPIIAIAILGAALGGVIILETSSPSKPTTPVAHPAAALIDAQVVPVAVSIDAGAVIAAPAPAPPIAQKKPSAATVRRPPPPKKTPPVTAPTKPPANDKDLPFAPKPR